MLLDDTLEFCDATSVAAAAANAALVGDVIDLGSPGFGGVANTVNFPGDAVNNVWVVATVSTQIITAGTAGSVQFFLMSDAQEAIDPVTGTIHMTSVAVLTDDAAAIATAAAGGDQSAIVNKVGGILLCAPLPSNIRFERYLGIVAVTLTAETTAGAINAFLTRTPARYIHYRDALASGA